MTQKCKDFGFIRISKNASTSICSIPELGLSEWSEISKFERPIYACLRHPKDRFFSGICETLFRANILDPIRGNRQDDVIISVDRMEELFSLNWEYGERFIDGFLQMIEKNGFFDAHHEPQINFLWPAIVSKDVPYKKGADYPVGVFPLDKMSDAVAHILKLHNYAHRKISFATPQNVWKNTNKVKDLKNENRPIWRAQWIFNRLIMVLRQQGGREVACKSLHSKNPLTLVAERQNISICEARKMFYHRLLRIKESTAFDSRLEKLYASDYWLYDKIKNATLLPIEEELAQELYCRARDL